MRSSRDTKIIRVLLALVLAGLLWLLGLPWLVDIFLIPAVVLLALYIEAGNSLLLVCGLLVAMGLGEAAFRILSHTGGAEQYYRFDDKYFRKGHYLQNVNDAMRMHHGDIAAMDSLAPHSICEERDVRFHTDDMGYRNDHNYSGEPVVVVGDSFVAGTDTDQQAILSNVLRDGFGLSTYSLGFPGNPDDYVAFASDFLRQKSNSVRFVFFIFEGNDLSCSSKQRLSHDSNSLTAYDKLKLRYANHINIIFKLPAALFNMAYRVTARQHNVDIEPTEVYSLGNKQVGFHGSYVDAALFPHCSFSLSHPDQAVLSRIAMMFFVPTKYRVYRPWLSKDSRALPEPSSGFTSLKAACDRLGIPAYDLTPILRQEADRLLAEGKLVFWRDDTHWNNAGIRAAAAFVADKLRGIAPLRPQ